MKNWLLEIITHPCTLVGVGGAVGSNLRYAISIAQRQWSVTQAFPVGTAISNVVGSFLIGCLAAKIADRSSPVYLFLSVGFCGGLTTFSALSLELVEHWNNHRFDRFLLAFGANLVLGLVVCYWAWKIFSGPATEPTP